LGQNGGKKEQKNPLLAPQARAQRSEARLKEKPIFSRYSHKGANNMPKKNGSSGKPPRKKSTRRSPAKKADSKKPAAKPLTKIAPKASAFLEEAAVQRNCLPLPKAVLLVVSCHGQGPSIPLSTKLGTLFPLQARRDQFCQCVADGVPTQRSQIPCGASNTLQDVVDAIKC
jgi:hypothetical protein